MDARRTILADGAIAVTNGRIGAIGPDREIAPSIDAAKIRDLQGAVIHPGLVDAHAHTGMDLVRVLLPESREFGIIEYPFSSTRSREEEYLSAMLSCMEMVLNGTTLYCDTGQSFDLEATVEAIDMVGMRGIPGYFLADERIPQDKHYDKYFSPTKATDECLAKLEDQIRRYSFHGNGRIRCVATLQGSGTASDALLKGAKQIAQREGVPMVMHQSWSEGEITKSKSQHGLRPVEHFAKLGLLGPDLTLVHMIRADEREIELIKDSGTSVVHCPNAAIRRAMGAIRVGKFPEMLNNGIPVGLGSDGWSGTHDIIRQAYLAASLFREMRDEVPIITAETALEMATLHGARALGMHSEVGSLEIGKRADLVIHRLDWPGPWVDDPVPNLVYYSQSRTIDTVMVDGEEILSNGRFTRFDASGVLNRINQAAIERQNSIGYKRGTWPIHH